MRPPFANQLAFRMPLRVPGKPLVCDRVPGKVTASTGAGSSLEDLPAHAEVDHLLAALQEVVG